MIENVPTGYCTALRMTGKTWLDRGLRSFAPHSYAVNGFSQL
jgi:hypothetical protein